MISPAGRRYVDDIPKRYALDSAWFGDRPASRRLLGATAAGWTLAVTSAESRYVNQRFRRDYRAALRKVAEFRRRCATYHREEHVDATE